MHDVLQTVPFQAPAYTVRDTTEEMCSIAAQYTTSSEKAQLCLAPSNGREASSDTAFQDTKEGANGGRKTHKQRL
jgi:hypothetical protein